MNMEIPKCYLLFLQLASEGRDTPRTLESKLVDDAVIAAAALLTAETVAFFAHYQLIYIIKVHGCAEELHVGIGLCGQIT